MADRLNEMIDRLEVVVSRLQEAASKVLPAAPPAPGTPSGPSSRAADAKAEGLARSVTAFDELLDSAVARVRELAEKIGGQVLEASKILEGAFRAERVVVVALSQCQKPSMDALSKLVAPVGEQLGKASALTEGKRTDAYNQLKAVAESLAALTWVVYSGKDCGMSVPPAHVDESWQAAEFFANKVLVEFKSKDPAQAEWVRALKELYTGRGASSLKEYCRAFHPAGPSWNAQGSDLSSFDAATAGGGVGSSAAPHPPAAAGSKAPNPPPAPPRGPPPPPPGGGPPPYKFASGAAAPAKGADMSKVFAELNKGEAVTSGLRRVTADMKTKNRGDRTGAVPAAAGSAPAAATSGGGGKTGAAAPQAAAKLELVQGRKWVVENQVDNKSLVISDTEPRQTVYIFNCRGCLIQTHGKVNNITMDKCSKTGLVFQDVVAACEVVNCTSVEVQCQGFAPTLAVDNTNGCQLYLSSTSLGASITTAKSSEINVLVPGKAPEDDMVEHALPEQFLSEFKDGNFVTMPVSHSGG